MTDKYNFLYPRATYRGTVKPEHLIFNANLQEFAHRVGYISNLETSGKISPNEAYNQIQGLWTTLKDSKQQLGIE